MMQGNRLSLKTKWWLRSLDKRISSAAMVLEDQAGRLLIVKANYKKHWTLPGGIVDRHETPLDAAVRETREEVGIEIDRSQVEFVMVATRSSKFFDSYQFVFRAPFKDSQLNDIVLQASEIDEYALVSREEVATGNRDYGKVIIHWAEGRTGYAEQTFGS